MLKSFQMFVSAKRNLFKGLFNCESDVISCVMLRPCLFVALEAATYANPSAFSVRSSVTCGRVFPSSGNNVWSSLRLRELRKLLEAQGAMRASRAYGEVIVSAIARAH